MPLKYKCERDDFTVIIFNFSNIGKLLVFIMTIKGNQSIKNKIICLTIRLLLILCSYSALASCKIKHLILNVFQKLFTIQCMNDDKIFKINSLPLSHSLSSSL